jgi:hypothetical protein
MEIAKEWKEKMVKFCEDKFLGYTMVVSYEPDVKDAFANRTFSFTMRVEVRDEDNQILPELRETFNYTDDIDKTS